ncbi:MAG: hypothetical protein CM15mV19_0280 [uncultured marine virus]|nr:MAG: hypothetical protein CM15mV19_0280 [uncultured marine virus]
MVRCILKTNATEEDFESVQSAKTAQQLECIMMEQEVADRKNKTRDIEKAKALKIGFEGFVKLDDFRREGNSCYLVGTNRSMPSLLVEKFIEVVYRVKSSNTMVINHCSGSVIKTKNISLLRTSLCGVV